jgi:NAD(P)-dependent dehydrogenase (short-subunit alcohol dehydrogenase family)
MMPDLDGHRTLVIGAAGTIGSAICRAYARAGASVWAADINQATADAVAASLGSGSHQGGAVDVTDPDSVEELARQVWRDGGVDSVAYAAGVTFTADIADTSWADYKRLMAVNLDGAFYTARSFGSRMLNAGRSGSFLFVSSTAGKRGEAGASAYCASKFGLIGMVESFAAEVTARGIRVNAICPGNVDSPMLRGVARDVALREGEQYETVMQRFTNVAGAHRLVAPEEVAAVSVWLASSLASAVSGESINVDTAALSG